MTKISYAGYRFPPVIIQRPSGSTVHLSFPRCRDLLAERGIMVSYETIRRWVKHFGSMVAADLRRRRPEPSKIVQAFGLDGGKQLPRRRAA
jgi:putative transposase